jgi:threonyl-tRNA synthetase
VYGSLERFIAILVEHFGGHFPTWLAPVQARVMSVTDEVNDYAHEVARRLREHELRVDVDDRSEKIGYKIREAELQKLPYMLVVGGRDREGGVVDVRSHGEGRRGTMTIDAVVEEIRKKVAEKTLDVKLQKVELWKEEDVVQSKMEETGY